MESPLHAGEYWAQRPADAASIQTAAALAHATPQEQSVVASAQLCYLMLPYRWGAGTINSKRVAPPELAATMQVSSVAVGETAC